MEANQPAPPEKQAAVITVRLTYKQRAALKQEAYRRRRSLNRLAVDALLALLPPADRTPIADQGWPTDAR